MIAPKCKSRKPFPKSLRRLRSIQVCKGVASQIFNQGKDCWSPWLVCKGKCYQTGVHGGRGWLRRKPNQEASGEFRQKKPIHRSWSTRKFFSTGLVKVKGPPVLNHFWDLPIDMPCVCLGEGRTGRLPHCQWHQEGKLKCHFLICKLPPLPPVSSAILTGSAGKTRNCLPADLADLHICCDGSLCDAEQLCAMEEANVALMQLPREMG